MNWAIHTDNSYNLIWTALENQIDPHPKPDWWYTLKRHIMEKMVRDIRFGIIYR